MAQLRTLRGDITRLTVDVVVNAANSSLLGGGGVDGAIHRAAGPDLVSACRLLGGCKTGEAKTTSGFGLPARWIVHTVGPVWRGGESGEPALLERCYRSALRAAAAVGAKSVAFPCISTGIFRYPPDRAAALAVATVKDEAEALGESAPAEVVFCCFTEDDRARYAALLEALEAPV